MKRVISWTGEYGTGTTHIEGCTFVSPSETCSETADRLEFAAAVQQVRADLTEHFRQRREEA